MILKQTTLYYNNRKPKYIGEVNEKGEFHGKGKLYRTDGTPIYEGEFEDGLPHGKGKLYKTDGTLIYEGEWKNNKAHGKGKMYYENGNLKYEGELKDDKFHGKGKGYHLNGNLAYEGENKDGEPHGNGKMYYENGNLEYEGEFLNGKYHGKGKGYRENGNLWYEGGFENGWKSGNGKAYLENGNLEYEGEFRNNMASKMSILTIKELKQAWKNYLFNGGEKIHFYIYEEKEIFGREIYTYQDKKGTHYLIINGINVLADVNACCCGYIGKGEFHYFLDPSTHKFGKFDFKTNTFKLDV